LTNADSDADLHLVLSQSRATTPATVAIIHSITLKNSEMT